MTRATKAILITGLVLILSALAWSKIATQDRQIADLVEAVNRHTAEIALVGSIGRKIERKIDKGFTIHVYPTRHGYEFEIEEVE